VLPRFLKGLFGAALLPPRLAVFEGAPYSRTEPHQAILEEVIRERLSHAVHHCLFADYPGEHDERYIETGLLQHFQRAKGVNLGPDRNP